MLFEHALAEVRQDETKLLAHKVWMACPNFCAYGVNGGQWTLYILHRGEDMISLGRSSFGALTHVNLEGVRAEEFLDDGWVVFRRP